MGTLNEDLTGIKAIEDKLTANKVANFAYTDHAYENPLTEADGVEYYDVDNEQNIPVPDPLVMDVNETVLTKGFRSQASSIPRMLMNHFLGRTSYNLNKLNDNMSSLLATLMSHLGSANGIAPLNANGVLDIAKGGTNASTVNGARTNLNINNVVNTGDSATPTENGTTKFTTGGAYTELNKKQDKTLSTALDINGSNTTTVESALSRLNGATYTTANYGVTASSVTCYKLTFDFGVEKVLRTVSFLVTGRQVTDSMILTLGGNGGSVDNWVVSAVLHGVNKRIAFKYDYTTSKVNIYVKLAEWQAYNVTQIEGEKVVFTTETCSESDFTSAQTMDIFKINDMVDLSTVAPIFSSSTSYSVGDYVVYNRVLYRCTVAHSAGAWNASHFTSVTVGGDLEAKANQTDLAVPSDATLHYSFDDVPDLPDGTAVYKRNENFASDEGWDVNTSTESISVSNGSLKIQSLGFRAYMGVLNNTVLSASNLNTNIIKVKFYCSDFRSVYLQDNGGSYDAHTIFTVNSLGNNRYEAIGVCGSYSIAQTLIFSLGSTSSDNYAIIEAIYIGDGSYSTPIIDNSGDNMNAVNNGGIAVQGVCGKGAYFTNGKYADIGNINLPNDFTISLWIKPSDNIQGEVGTILGKSGVLRILNGASWTGGTNAIHISIYTEGNENYGYFGSLLPANTWTHFAVLKSGNTAKVYLNGILSYTKTLSSTTVDVNNNPLELNRYPQFPATRPQTYDDLLIFNRALSEDEVTALYLNKANTPKFYNLNNYLLDNRSAVPAENGTDLFTTGGAYSLLQSVDNSKAPIDHASTTTDYGVATTTKYGHVLKHIKLGCIYYSTGNGDITARLSNLQGYGLVRYYVIRGSTQSYAEANITLLNDTGDTITFIDLEDSSVHELSNNETYFLGQVYQQLSSGSWLIKNRYILILPNESAYLV